MQYIPGPEALLAPVAAQLGQALQTMINPNLEAQKTLQMAVARNPALLQQLADAEANAPGTMSQLGFGRIGETIAAMPASPEAQYMIKNRAEIVKGMEAQLGAESAKSRFSTTNIEGALKVMQEHPEISFDAATKMVTGQTMAERTIEGTKAELAGATSDALKDPKTRQLAGSIGATGMTPGKLAEDKFTADSLQAATKMLEDGVPITMQKFLNNEYSSEQLNAIYSTPMGKALSEQIGAYSDQLRIRIMANNQGDDIKRLKMAQAFEFMTKIRGGTMDSAMSYLNDPDAAERAEAMIKDPSLVKTPEDRALVNTHKQFKQFDDSQRRVEISALGKNLLAQRQAFQSTFRPKAQGGVPGKEGDDQRQMLIGEINETLRQRSLFGAPAYTASYELVPRHSVLSFMNQKELVYKDAQGKIVPPELVDLPLLSGKAPGEQPAAGTGKYGKFVSQYKTLSGGMQRAQLERWAAELSPAQFAELKAELGVK